jgi:hypothetical protein
LLKDNTETKILTNIQYISIVHTNELEKVKVGILTTTPNSKYFKEENIGLSNIKNTDNTVSLKIDKVLAYDDQYEYQEDVYYLVEFFFTLPFKASNMIRIDDAILSINYSNGDNLSMYIGEFNYAFLEETNDLTLGNLSATYGYIDGIETVSGINLTLNNVSNQNITINKIEVLSTNIQINNEYTIKREECHYKESVENCLDIDIYDPHKEPTNEHSFVLRVKNDIDMYLPLYYKNKETYIYRFGLMITYTINGEEKTYIIDDFPYMTKSIYLEEMEGNYREATIYQNQ